MKLPFNDEWLVYQGGRNVFDNGYAMSDDQRFSMDFVYLKNGKLFAGKGGITSKAEDYYCFGQPILSPADGKVIKAESGYDDTDPGKATGDPADGNVRRHLVWQRRDRIHESPEAKQSEGKDW